MRFDWDLEPEWWLAVAVAALLVVVLLVLAVVAYSSYRGMRRQRDETRKRLDLARQELADIRIELEEARAGSRQGTQRTGRGTAGSRQGAQRTGRGAQGLA